MYIVKHNGSTGPKKKRYLQILFDKPNHGNRYHIHIYIDRPIYMFFDIFHGVHSLDHYYIQRPVNEKDRNYEGFSAFNLRITKVLVLSICELQRF